MSQAETLPDKDLMARVRADIERIKDALGSERWRPGTVAVFSCSGRAWPVRGNTAAAPDA